MRMPQCRAVWAGRSAKLARHLLFVRKTAWQWALARLSWRVSHRYAVDRSKHPPPAADAGTWRSVCNSLAGKPLRGCLQDGAAERQEGAHAAEQAINIYTWEHYIHNSKRYIQILKQYIQILGQYIQISKQYIQNLEQSIQFVKQCIQNLKEHIQMLEHSPLSGMATCNLYALSSLRHIRILKQYIQISK